MTSHSLDGNTLPRHVKLENFAISFGKLFVMWFLKNPVSRDELLLFQHKYEDNFCEYKSLSMCKVECWVLANVENELMKGSSMAMEIGLNLENRIFKHLNIFLMLHLSTVYVEVLAGK